MGDIKIFEPFRPDGMADVDIGELLHFPTGGTNKVMVDGIVTVVGAFVLRYVVAKPVLDDQIALQK